MNKGRLLVAVTGVLVVVTATPAAAQTRGGGGSDWSILGAETVPTGADVVHGAFGWPDATFGWTHGMRPGFDVGARMSFLYGIENTTDSQFGLALAMPLRWELSRQGNAHLLVHVDPGLRLYTFSDAMFGFQFPFGLNLEFPTRMPLKVGLGVDFNASLFVTGFGSPQFFFGPLIGPYFEMHVDPRLVVGVDTRFGAIVDAYSGEGFRSGGTDTRFGFRTQMLLAYHL